jgi:hypothetical protein
MSVCYGDDTNDTANTRYKRCLGKLKTNLKIIKIPLSQQHQYISSKKSNIIPIESVSSSDTCLI